MKKTVQEVKHLLIDKIKTMSPHELQEFVLGLGMDIYWDGKFFVANEDNYERPGNGNRNWARPAYSNRER